MSHPARANGNTVISKPEMLLDLAYLFRCFDRCKKAIFVRHGIMTA